MITPSYSATATERVLPRLALDFTTGVLDPRVTVTRALNTATRTNASGILEIVNANLPRFDYDPSTLTCKGLLIEESRTNILLNSLINGTVLSTQIVTVSATAYTISFYGTGTITLSGAHVAVVTGSGAYPSRKTYTFTPTAGALTVTVTGTVQFAQLEAGAFATSYIPTTTTTATRDRDLVRMTGTNFSSWFNQSEGTIVCSVSGGKPKDGSSWAVSYDMTGAGSSHLAYVRQTSATAISGVINVNSSAALSISAGAPYKTALAYKNGDCAFSLNGGSPSLFSGTPGTPIELAIGSLNDVFFLNGHVELFEFFPQRLINAEVQTFSKRG